MGCKLSVEEGVVISEARQRSLEAIQSNTPSLIGEAFPLADMGQLVANLVQMAPPSPMIRLFKYIYRAILSPKPI